MLINTDPIFRVLRRPVLGRFLVVLGSVVFWGIGLGIIPTAIVYAIGVPVTEYQFKIAVAAASAFGLFAGLVTVARR